MTNASVRYMVEDVTTSIEFYVTHLDFMLEQDARPASASVTRESRRLLLSGPGSSGARAMLRTTHRNHSKCDRPPSAPDLRFSCR